MQIAGCCCQIARERWRKLFGDRLPGGHETFRGAINVAEFVKAR